MFHFQMMRSICLKYKSLLPHNVETFVGEVRAKNCELRAALQRYENRLCQAILYTARAAQETKKHNTISNIWRLHGLPGLECVNGA